MARLAFERVVEKISIEGYNGGGVELPLRVNLAAIPTLTERILSKGVKSCNRHHGNRFKSISAERLAWVLMVMTIGHKIFQKRFDIF